MISILAANSHFDVQDRDRKVQNIMFDFRPYYLINILYPAKNERKSLARYVCFDALNTAVKNIYCL